MNKFTWGADDLTLVGTNDNYTAAPNSFVTVTSEGVFSGYASLFNVPDMEGDIVIPGAFALSLSEKGIDGVRMLFEHNSSEPIGKWLTLKEDQYGLFVRGQLNMAVERAREIKALMETGACDGMSIAGLVTASMQTEHGSRLLASIDLWEISVCSFPTQKQAGVDGETVDSLLKAYGSRERLPAAVRRVLPSDALEAYRRAFNRFVRVHPDGSYARAHAIAWRAVRKMWQPPHNEVGKWARRMQGDCKMQMQDTVALDGSRRTEDGFLAGEVRVARTGIQIYRGIEVGRPEMAQVRVYRPANEVFHKDAMHSFSHRPVTLDHPEQMVTSKNWKQFAVGQTGSEVLRDGEFIRVPMVLMDAEAVQAVVSGKKQLSMGYTCDLKWQDGVSPEGEQYDAIQTAIRANHLAVVSMARGGHELHIDSDSDIEDAVSLNGEGFAYAKSLIAAGKITDEDFDGEGTNCNEFLAFDGIDSSPKYPFAKDGVLYRSALRAIRSRASQVGADAVFEAAGKLIESLDSKTSSSRKETTMSHKVEVDGLEVEVVDATHAAILRKGLASLIAKAQALAEKLRDAAPAPKDGEAKSEFMTRCTEGGGSEEACAVSWEKASASAAKDAEIVALTQAVKDAELTPAKLDEAVKSRADLIASAKVICDKVVVAGKTAAEIRRAVVDAKLGEKVKGWSDEQIATGFETMAAFASEKPSSGNLLAEAIRDKKPASSASDDKDKAYDENVSRMKDAWRTKK